MAGSETVPDQKLASSKVGFKLLVAGLGLEPRLSASEAPVLPLYYPAISERDDEIIAKK